MPRDNREDDSGEYGIDQRPFQDANGQWWNPTAGAVSGNPDDVTDEYLQSIWRDYGLDLRPRMVGDVSAIPFDDHMRYFNMTPGAHRSYFQEVAPFLLAAGGGALASALAPGAMVADAAGMGGGFAGEAAAASAAAGLPAGVNYTVSTLPEVAASEGIATGATSAAAPGYTTAADALTNTLASQTAAGGGAAAGGALGGMAMLNAVLSGALPAAASLAGAGIASKSASKAIDAQTQGTNAALAATSQAAQDAIAEQRRQFDLNRADYAPYREVGNQAVGRINGMLAPGGDLTRRFTVGDFYADPVTQLSMDFGLSEGRKALERAARANGSLNAGGTLKALTRYGTDYAGQRANESYNRFYGDQDRTFNRNASLAGLGQTATAGTVNAGQNSANNIAGITTNQGNTIGNLYSSLGNSRGAASIAQGNTFNNALSNIGNWWTNQNMLDSLLKART